MALYPGARQRPITPGANDPAIIVVGAILHVDAANSKSLYGYFSGPSGGIESHFHVPKELQVEQYRDTGREADANLKANSFIKNGKRYGFISIETQGFGAGEWNAYQLAEIKALLLWLSKTHNFPLRRCPGPFEAGVGYHTMWGAPSEWTPIAKDCPGPDRVKQFGNVLVPWFAAASKPPPGSTPIPPEDDDVALTTQQEIDIRAAGWLAQQFAQDAQFENDLDGIDALESKLPTLATKADVAALAKSVADLAALINAKVV